MAFTMDGIVIDRIQMGIAEDSRGNLLYTLTQLSDAKIDISADSKDAKDANGTLIKRFYTGKSGEFSANNAIIDFNILGAATGTGKEVASAEKSFKMPTIIYTKAGDKTLTLLAGADAATVKVNLIANNGTMGAAMAKDAQAAENKFAVSASTLTLPTNEGAQFVVKYDRTVQDNAVRVLNKADEYPSTIKLTLKALAVDPCDTGVLRGCYIVLPSFQVSPETSISLTTDSQLEYKGTLQVNYCAADKTLYEIYMADDEAEA